MVFSAVKRPLPGNNSTAKHLNIQTIQRPKRETLLLFILFNTLGRNLIAVQNAQIHLGFISLEDAYESAYWRKPLQLFAL